VTTTFDLSYFDVRKQKKTSKNHRTMQRRKLPLKEITEHVKKTKSIEKEQEKSTAKPKKKMVE